MNADAMQSYRHISEVKVGNRHRKEMGDITALARDINERGLLHPIVVDQKNRLIAGERRLKAWQLSNFREQPIPVHVVPLEDIVAGEWAENDPTLRKNFTPSEAVAIARELRPRLEVASKKRQQEHGGTAPGRKAEHSAQVAPSVEAEKGRAVAKIARATGKGARTLEKAEAIVEAAEKEPAKFGKLKADMDKSGRVDGPFKRLQTMKAAEQIRKEPPPLPGNGPYRGMVIDFPWAAEPDDDDPERLARGYYPYATMSMNEIAEFCALSIVPLLHRDCTVAVWITNYHLALGHQLHVFNALELKPTTILTWRKSKLGRGQVARGTTEHVIIARRGKSVIETFPRTDYDWPSDKVHSRKPQSFFDLFAKHVPAPRYATLFETVDRGPLWDGHGDKITLREAA